MTLLNIINEMSETPEPFIAPIPVPTTTLYTYQRGLPYRLTLEGQDVAPGFYYVVPFSRAVAKVERPAYTGEIREYLNRARVYYAIVAGPGPAPNTILVVPYNPADAAQRGWRDAEPKVAYVLKPFLIDQLQYMTAKVYDTSTFFVYDSLSFGLSYPDFIDRDDLRGGYLVVKGLVEQIREKDRLAQKERERQMIAEMIAEAKRNTESNFRLQLQMAGATMREYREVGDSYQVTYSYEGMTRTVTVGQTGRVISSGICLSGRDRDYDLATIVDIVGRREYD